MKVIFLLIPYFIISANGYSNSKAFLDYQFQDFQPRFDTVEESTERIKEQEQQNEELYREIYEPKGFDTSWEKKRLVFCFIKRIPIFKLFLL